MKRSYNQIKDIYTYTLDGGHEAVILFDSGLEYYGYSTNKFAAIRMAVRTMIECMLGIRH